MSASNQYRIVGAAQSSGAPIDTIVVAENAAAARALIESRGVVVSFVEPLGPSTPTAASAVGSAAPSESLGRQPQATAVPSLSPLPKPRPKRESRVYLSLLVGWPLALFATVAGVGMWLIPNTMPDEIFAQAKRNPSLTNIVICIERLLLINVLALSAVALALTTFLASRRSRGGVLLGVSIASVIAATTAQFRPTAAPSKLVLSTAGPTPEQANKAAGAIEKLIESSRESRTSTQRSGVPDAPSAEQMGDMAHFVQITQNVSAAVGNCRADYLNAIRELELGVVLTPLRLDTEPELLESREKLAAARRSLDQNVRCTKQIFDAAREDIRNLPVDEQLRRGAIHGFNESMSYTLPFLEKWWLCEREFIDETVAVLDLIHSQFGKVTVKGERLLFQSAPAANTYNRSIKRIQAIAAHEKALMAIGDDAAKYSATHVRDAMNGDNSAFDRIPTRRFQRSNDRVDLAASGASIQARTLTFPLTLDRLTAILGEPSRTVTDSVRRAVWDDLGIFAYTEIGRDDVEGIAITLNQHDSTDSDPKEIFRGTITIAGVEVNDLDTPATLNRRLTDLAFEEPGQSDSCWILDFKSYNVHMKIAPYGLTEQIFIHGPTPDPSLRDTKKSSL